MAKTLIPYFFHAGQNYSHGGIRNLPVGNTEVVAKKIHALTAQVVNERACGRGIKDSNLKRDEVFISTKLWPSEYENPNAVDETLERLGVDYVDLLYIHQPAGNWMAGYRQLEKAYKYGIKLMSWYPLGHGDTSLMNEPIFTELGKKYGKTSAQVILRWHTQMGFVVIPGSKNVDHIKDNLDILDFKLTDDEMTEIAKLDKGERYYHRTDEQLAGFAAWRPEFERA